MDLPDPANKTTLQEYLDLELSTGVRHEWVNGVAYAMSGGTAEHAAIKTNATVSFGSRLRGSPCRVADSDQRIHVLETVSSFYADLVVVCGGYVFASDDDNAVTNPVVVVEVLSPSTEDYDRGTKFQHYRRMASLQEYVLISQDEQRVEVRRRVEAGWLVIEITRGELELSSIGISVPLDEVYDLAGVRDAVNPID